MLGFGVVAQAASYRMAFLCAGILAMAIGGGYALVSPGSARARPDGSPAEN